jgi:putative endonuclease
LSEAAYVYVLASEPYGTLYVGVTSDLMRRVWEHKNGYVEGCTKRYGVERLVWFEQHESIVEAIAREKRIKRWHRDWKVNLVQAMNPRWDDLYDELTK